MDEQNDALAGLKATNETLGKEHVHALQIAMSKLEVPVHPS